MSTSTEPLIYTVVTNDEDQYSIWYTDSPVPSGWREVGYRGVRAQCLEYIQRVWLDLRPRSLRSPTCRE